MSLLPHFLGVTDLLLEEGEVLLIFILAGIAAATAAYIRHLRVELHHQKRQLDEQAKFNAKLNDTVDRILAIDEKGGIDSNRSANAVRRDKR